MLAECQHVAFIEVDALFSSSNSCSSSSSREAWRESVLDGLVSFAQIKHTYGYIMMMEDEEH